MRDTSSVISTVVFPETVQHAELMLKTLRRFSRKPIIVFYVRTAAERYNGPALSADCRVPLDIARLYQMTQDRPNRGINDLAKAMCWSHLVHYAGAKEMLHIDTDCLVLQPIDDIFKLRGDILMAQERMDFYEPYLKRWECPCPQLRFNAGVILMRKDYLRYWLSYYNQMCDWLGDNPHGEGQLVWNLVWQKDAGEADVLPQKYNQLHVKHGPHGAAIYHMAGLSQNMKLEVMKSCYRQFLGEEP